MPMIFITKPFIIHPDISVVCTQKKFQYGKVSNGHNLKTTL